MTISRPDCFFYLNKHKEASISLSEGRAASSEPLQPIPATKPGLLSLLAGNEISKVFTLLLVED